MLYLLVGFPVFLFVVYVVVGVVVRLCAIAQFYWYFIPENTFAAVVSKDDPPTGNMVANGGGIITLGHNIPGYVLVADGDDRSNWSFVPGVEKRGLLFRLYGVHKKGLFTEIRTNLIKSTRYGRPELKPEDADSTKGTKAVGKADFIVYSEDQWTQFVYFSGQQAVEVRSAETLGTFGLDVKYNIILERIYPVRSLTRVADAQGTLTEMTQERTIMETGSRPPEDYLSGPPDAKMQLVKSVENVTTKTEEQLGLRVASVTLFSVDPDANERGLRELLELSSRTRREKQVQLEIALKDQEIKSAQATGDAQAIVIRAEAEKTAKMLGNDAQADFVERVVKPTGNTPGGPEVAWARAYENNGTVTVFAPGGGVNPILSPDFTKKKQGDATTKP